MSLHAALSRLLLAPRAHHEIRDVHRCTVDEWRADVAAVLRAALPQLDRCDVQACGSRATIARMRDTGLVAIEIRVCPRHAT